MWISWCFSLLNRAGGSAGTLIPCPKALAMTRENRLNCSSFSASYPSSSGWCAHLSSRLLLLSSSGFLRDPSPSSSGSPPHSPPRGRVALYCGGGGGLPPPAPQASGVGSDTWPFPFTCPINCSTRALRTAISPSCASQDSGWRHSSSLTRLMLIS